MAKFLKAMGVVVLLIGAVAATSVPAQARWQGGYHHGWHGGGWGPGFGLGLGLGTAWGYPYYYGGGPYYGGPYYAGPACRWTRVRVWRGDHWALRTVRRCY